MAGNRQNRSKRRDLLKEPVLHNVRVAAKKNGPLRDAVQAAHVGVNGSLIANPTWKRKPVRVGARPPASKKLPWDEAVATELAFCLPVNAETHSRLGYPEKAKPDVPGCLCRYLVRPNFRTSKALTRRRDIRSNCWWSGIHNCPTPDWPTASLKGRAERVNRKAEAIRGKPRGTLVPPVSGKRSCALSTPNPSQHKETRQVQ